MKKELFALFTILLLIALSIGNIWYLERLTETIDTHIAAASDACGIEDYEAAHAELTKALHTWLKEDHYTHVFIRHSEIDSTTDAFYDALEAVRCQDGLSASAALEKLNYHLTSILTMEYVTIRSIF